MLAGEIVKQNGLIRKHGFCTTQPLVRYIGWGEIVRAMFDMECDDEMFHLRGGPVW